MSDSDIDQPEETQGASSSTLHRDLTATGSFISRNVQPRVWDEEERRNVLNELFFEGPEWRPFVARFATLIVLSTTIAAFGLIASSAAVVIGAMLVAPLMTPILAIAASLVHGQISRLLTSVGVLVAGTAAAVFTGWLVSRIGGQALLSSELSPELLARTVPSLLDLGVAIAAGLAGGYVLTHPRVGSSLPGVAIAVALVPPLATVGITIELGQTTAAEGAMLLYTTNLVAIVLSAMIVMLLTGFVPDDVRAVTRGKIRTGLAVAALAVVAVAVPLTLHTLDVIADQSFTRDVISTVQVWDPSGRIIDLEADIDGNGATVNIVMASSESPAPAWRLAEELAANHERPVNVAVQYRLEVHDEATAD